MGLAHPIADARGLGDAAAHVAEVDAAHSVCRPPAENEKPVALIAAPLGRHLAQPTAIGGAALSASSGQLGSQGTRKSRLASRSSDQARQSAEPRPTQQQARRLQPWSADEVEAEHGAEGSWCA